MSVENNYLEMQIVNQIQLAENFKNTCKIATTKDDGITSKEEQKILNKINRETDAFIKGLRKILQ